MSSIGLPPHYRFTVKNETGQTIASSSITVTAKRAKFDSSGVLTYEGSEATVFSYGSTLGNGGFASGSTQDNTTNKYLGGDFLFTVTAPTSSSGHVILYLERSTDAGTTWDSNGDGEAVASLYFTASGTKRASFAI